MENNYWKERYLDIMSQLRSLRDKNQELTEALSQAVEHANHYKARVAELERQKALSGHTDLPYLSLQSLCGLNPVIQSRISMGSPAKQPPQSCSPKDPDLFEQFYIIGSDQVPEQAVKGRLFQPKILCQHPKTSSFNPCILGDFAFPEGLKPEYVDFSDSCSAVYSLLYANYQRDCNSFIFTVKSIQQQGSLSIDIANKDLQFLYCCCVVSNEMTNNDYQGKSEFPLMPRCYCLVSYYPCFELHFEVLYRLLSIKKVLIMSEIAPDTQRETPKSDTFRTAASFSDIEELHPEEIALLEAYKKQSIRQSELKIPLELVPEIDLVISSLSIIDCEWICPTLFTLLDFESFFRLLCAFSNQRSIIFVSSNLDHLTSCVLAMIALLRPFNWPHLMCPILPESLKDVLEAPVPLIGGVIRPVNEMLHPDIICVHLEEESPVSIENQAEPQSQIKQDLRELYMVFHDSGANEDMKADALSNIVSKLKGFWMDMVNRIPPPETRQDMENIDMEAIRKSIIENTSGEDREFTECFVETQFFINAVEGIYQHE